MSREFLVTKLVCAKCGTNLSLSDETPQGAGRYSEGEPTGASMLRQVVAVEPCQPCMEPLRKLKDALATLKGVSA